MMNSNREIALAVREAIACNIIEVANDRSIVTGLDFRRTASCKGFNSS